LPKIKAWIDTNNPGDPLIPFSVALEERLALMTSEEKKEEEAKVGATGALPKITQAGYTSLDVSLQPFINKCNLNASLAHPLFHLRS
jgi:obg-like ATPase 1